MTKHTIVIVDDHALLSATLADRINATKMFAVKNSFKNGKEAINYLSTKKNIPDIVLLDINMPIMNGFETLEWLTANVPTLPVLALTMNDDDDSIIRMIKLGAKGYLVKDTNFDELVNALENVIAKGFYYSDLVTSKIVSNIHEEGKINEQKIVLKEKEIEFLQWICTEKTYKEIAQLMYLSPKTIDGYRDALLEKLGLKSRIGLVVYAIKNGYYTM